MPAEMKPQIMTSKPDPDPTILTTEALLREVAGLKELFQAKIDAIEKEMDDVHQNVHAIPHQRAIDIAALEELIGARFDTMNEKFSSVQTQFAERDIRVEQTARDSKVAVDAALQAAKEAVGEQNKSSGLSIAKSETATIKMIDSQGVLINTAVGAINDKIEDLKERLTRFESGAVGASDMRVDQRAHGASIAQIVGVAAAIVLGGLSLAVSVMWHTVK